MDKENMRHYKALLYATKYKIDTKEYCYWMKLGENINGTQELCGYSDADYSGDNDTRKRVTGYIVLINGAVIAWRFQSQKTVTLSITEAEYSTITEVCCEILFIRDILLFMRFVVEYTIIVHVDNIGEIFL